MDKNYLAIVILISISILLLLLFVKRALIKKALFALLVAQLFSWPITLVVVYFGLQRNPVRLFPYATDSTFLFAFIFHPAIFVVYYLHYPREARFLKRLLFTMFMPVLASLTQLLTDSYTDLIHFPHKWILIGLFFITFTIYNLARKYTDWFFNKSFSI